MRNLRNEQQIMQEWNDGPKKPLVSICCVTYNHEPFIEDALEGFLIQETNFQFEILIHDDASTDKTADIIREYEKKYPNLIKPIFQKENQYSKGGKPGRINRERAKGKYIAHCEGDDYWTDPLKLQKQVSFLEANPDYSMCFHSVKIWKASDKKLVIDDITRDVPDTTDIYELAKGNYIQTPSVVYRFGLIKEFPPQMNKTPVQDYFLHMLNAQYGKIKKLNEVMAVYRVHSGGIWSTKDKRDTILIYLDLMIDYFKDPQVILLLKKRKKSIMASGSFFNKIKRNFKKMGSFFYMKERN